MVCVLPAHPNRSSKPMVNVGATPVKLQVIDGGTALRVQFGAHKLQLASSSATRTVGNKDPTAD